MDGVLQTLFGMIASLLGALGTAFRFLIVLKLRKKICRCNESTGVTDLNRGSVSISLSTTLIPYKRIQRCNQSSLATDIIGPGAAISLPTMLNF